MGGGGGRERGGQGWHLYRAVQGKEVVIQSCALYGYLLYLLPTAV